MSKVTVVVATRNRAGQLARTLDRLRALPERPPITVVDNGSTDVTVPLVRQAFPDVHLLALGRNEGAVARNHGVAAAATPYVAFADDDSWWAPGALGHAQALFDAYPRLALIAAHTLVGRDQRVDPMSAFMATAPLGRPADLPGPSVLGFLACAAVLRRDVFLDCGGFDPVVFFMGEEARVAYDLTAAGWGLSYCANVVAHHHPARGGSVPEKLALAARNAALTAWMRRPMPIVVAHTISVLRMGSADGSYRRAFLQLVTRLPRALANRRRPQPVVEAALARLANAHSATGYAPHPQPRR
jgi:GT2 family glycosyltransferase